MELNQASTAQEADALAIKRAAQEQWSQDPAGSNAAGPEELGTRESFARVERHRYEEQWWMHETFRFDRFAGKDALEIGVGLGTDHLQFARAGARLTGIDITPRCVELTRRRFEQQGLRSQLSVMDAEHLEFDDHSFDAVYSFGVLHHTASAERAFAEVRRVLRSGGVFIGGVYNRYSLYMAMVAGERILRREWRRESFKDRLSRIEYSSSENQPKPYVRLFTRAELRRMLHDAGFAHVSITLRHSPFGQLRRWFPHSFDAAVGRTAGWYLIYEAA